MEGDKAASDAVSLILIKVHDHSRIQLLSCKAKLQSCIAVTLSCKAEDKTAKLQDKAARSHCQAANLYVCKTKLQCCQSCLSTLSLVLKSIYLKIKDPPKKTNRESKFRGVGLRGENAERQSPQLCERTRRPGKPVNPRKAGWAMVGNNPPKNTTSVLERGESAWHRRR